MSDPDPPVTSRVTGYPHLSATDRPNASRRRAASLAIAAPKWMSQPVQPLPRQDFLLQVPSQLRLHDPPSQLRSQVAPALQVC